MNLTSLVDPLVHHLAVNSLARRLSLLDEPSLDLDTIQSILESAARFSQNHLLPLDSEMDRAGCRLEDGQVRTSPSHRNAWNVFVADGWPALTLPERFGGQSLPLVVQTACEMIWNAGSVAFSMLPTPGRTGATLLLEHGGEALIAAWLPSLTKGESVATICISEPDAGSDVGRIRTRAHVDTLGRWSITGEKCWISYGDHDLSDQICHLLLARTGEEPGVRGLSLFLVPNALADGSPNGVAVRRIEEKMGLHGSPTCTMGFEGARGFLIGQTGRGLQQMFTMVLRMRLSVGCQGVGVASRAFETARRYAQERKQGGAADAAPVAISSHGDVQRQLLSMAGRVETARGLTLAAASALDLSERAVSAKEREEMLALAQWLLPLVKDHAGGCGFDVADAAIQVLGGAGYTKEWPVEQLARDARIFTIFEGTSGIQAIDLLHRRLWREAGTGLTVFLKLARDAISACPSYGEPLIIAIDELESVRAQLRIWEEHKAKAEAGAVHFLNLASLVACGWIAVEIMGSPAVDDVGRRAQAGCAFFLQELPARARAEADLAVLGCSRLARFEELNA